MKKSGKCPKCGSNEITMAAVYDYDIRLGVSRLSALETTQFLCCSCGYTEQWLNRSALIQAKNHYENQKRKGEM